jgi:hypothetical protein
MMNNNNNIKTNLAQLKEFDEQLLALLHFVAKSWREEVQRKKEEEQNRLEANDIVLETRASEEMGCTCNACKDVIRKEIEDEKHCLT